MQLPTPHLDKLHAALQNEKISRSASERLESGSARYNRWIADMNAVSGDKDELVIDLVTLLNEYKYFIDFEQIFLCEDDFLYRQRGQLKLDNTVIEEFLPHLVIKLFPQLDDFTTGPTKCFSASYFTSSLRSSSVGGGIAVRTKNQDFAIGRKLYVKSSHQADFENGDSIETFLGYITAECKTNLDKTMFQEATATARDMKSALPASKYFLLCEWLDMTPLSTASTDIDEVLIMRKAKRIDPNKRKLFGTYAKRMELAEWYSDFLVANPFDSAVFDRLIRHIDALLNDEHLDEDTVLEDGFF